MALIRTKIIQWTNGGNTTPADTGKSQIVMPDDLVALRVYINEVGGSLVIGEENILIPVGGTPGVNNFGMIVTSTQAGQLYELLPAIHTFTRKVDLYIFDRTTGDSSMTFFADYLSDK